MTKEKTKQETEEIKENRCSKCNSRNIHIRIKTKERVCRQCGFIEVIKGDGE